MSTIEIPDNILGELRRFLAASPGLPDGNLQTPDVLGEFGYQMRQKLAAELRPQARMLLGLHIPKTAGLTFSHVLAEMFREDFFRSYWEITDCRGQVVPDFPATARCIHGHINLGHLLAIYPNSALVTWVRNPVQRVVSQYQYWRREPDWRHPLCRTLHERGLSLLEFARHDQVRNEMTRFFGDLNPVDFSFIGIFEELPASMDLFRRKFGAPQMPLAHGHQNPDRGAGDYALSARERVMIAELNARDWELYWECVQRFGEECRAQAA